MVDKVENLLPTDEPRMTFDYSRVNEMLPGCHLALGSKVHNHLSNHRHGCLFSADFKHAYLAVPFTPGRQTRFSRSRYQDMAKSNRRVCSMGPSRPALR